MARTSTFVPGTGLIRLISDREWLTLIAALLGDKSPEAVQLAAKLMHHTKHGRQVRLIRLLVSRGFTVEQMEAKLKASRRTLFRDLNSLESYGFELIIGGDFRYRLGSVPRELRRLL